MLSDPWTKPGTAEEAELGKGVCGSPAAQLLLSPYRVLTSGHQPSSVLRSPAVGTLGGDFLSSLPLHEYPPAFPLGADIQGRTPVVRRALPCHPALMPDWNP